MKIISGTIGADARAIGGAALPLIKNFARDREVLFKDAPNGTDGSLAQAQLVQQRAPQANS